MMIKLKIKTLTGKEIEIDVDEDDTIAHVKERVEEQAGVPPAQQRLIFAGKQLPDNQTIKQLKIPNFAVVHLVLALRGGQWDF